MSLTFFEIATGPPLVLTASIFSVAESPRFFALASARRPARLSLTLTLAEPFFSAALPAPILTVLRPTFALAVTRHELAPPPETLQGTANAPDLTVSLRATAEATLSPAGGSPWSRGLPVPPPFPLPGLSPPCPGGSPPWPGLSPPWPPPPPPPPPPPWAIWR